jgi:hypothetical protein
MYRIAAGTERLVSLSHEMRASLSDVSRIVKVA